MRQFLVLGTHADLAAAEYAAVTGDTETLLLGSILLTQGTVPGLRLQQRLGGLVKGGDILAALETRSMTAETLADLIPPQTGKITFGLTVYGSPSETARFEHLAIQLKRVWQERGAQPRWMTGEEGMISPAAVLKLGLIETGLDLVVVIDGGTAYFGKTTHVQDPDAWSARDFEKPFRDAKTGMLPPKLARMLVNLAIGTRDPASIHLLDPFCGSGTVLMEASVMGVGRVTGGDIDERQVKGARDNMNWLKTHGAQARHWDVLRASADVIPAYAPIHAIVTEGFLGKPLQGREGREALEAEAHRIETLWETVAPHLASLQPKGATLVLLSPEYAVRGETVQVQLAPVVEAAGYRMTRVPFVYRRPGQFVHRHVLSFEKN